MCVCLEVRGVEPLSVFGRRGGLHVYPAFVLDARWEAGVLCASEPLCYDAPRGVGASLLFYPRPSHLEERSVGERLADYAARA